MARVKICGITTPEAFEAAAAAEWVGLNFVPASPRALTPQAAGVLDRGGPPGPDRVGLFVDPSDDEVAAVLAQVRLAALQLYAPPERVRALRLRFGVPVWQAVAISARDDLPRAGADQPDAYVFDAKAPPDAAIPGGNAERFDWPLVAGWRGGVPWLLAGGLTSENVTDAVAVSGAAAVDVSSGVERVRGVKDAALVRAFVAAAHSAA